MVSGIHQVVLIDDAVFAWGTAARVRGRLSLLIPYRHLLAVPIIQTGPWDSDMIPRPV